jgi:uncharacterized protein (DUF1499 family)
MASSRSAAVVRALALTGACLAGLCATAALLAGLGHRVGWWDYRTGFSILRWSAWGGLAAGGASLFGLIAPARARVLAAAGLLVGLSVFIVPWSYLHRRPEGPPIHDITTDTANPPRFVAVLPLRKDATNTADYEGPAAAAQQQRAYPDIAPLRLAVPPHEAFARSLNVAKALGWDIVAAVPGEGRIEATDTTLFFGFKDDIVIRIAPSGDGSRVDVRSVSRVGRSDLGANAKRVRAFLAGLAR